MERGRGPRKFGRLHGFVVSGGEPSSQPNPLPPRTCTGAGSSAKISLRAPLVYPFRLTATCVGWGGEQGKAGEQAEYPMHGGCWPRGIRGCTSGFTSSMCFATDFQAMPHIAASTAPQLAPPGSRGCRLPKCVAQCRPQPSCSHPRNAPPQLRCGRATRSHLRASARSRTPRSCCGGRALEGSRRGGERRGRVTAGARELRPGRFVAYSAPPPTKGRKAHA